MTGQSLDVTIRQHERVERLWRRYQREALNAEVTEVLAEALDIDIRTSFGGRPLPTPFIAGSGVLTASLAAVESAVLCGWGGVVLNPVAGEAPDGSASLADWRTAGSWSRNWYHPADAAKERPVVHTNALLDERGLEEYCAFASAAAEAASECGAVAMASLLCRTAEEWSHTSGRLAGTGLAAAEAAFLPVMEQETPSEELPGLYAVAARETGPNIPLWPRLLSLRDDRELWMQCARSSMDAGAAGVIAGAAFPAGEHRASHSGEDLRRLYVERVSLLEGVQVSARGGVYCGLHALEYILAGASTVQVYSFLAGKVRVVYKQSMNKFEQVLLKLLLDPADGLAVGLCHLRNRFGTGRVEELVGLGRSHPEAVFFP